MLQITNPPNADRRDIAELHGRHSPGAGRRIGLSLLVAALVPIGLAACGSDTDDVDDDTELDGELDDDTNVPFDPDVDDGVDTNVEADENLNFDETEQPGFDD